MYKHKMFQITQIFNNTTDEIHKTIHQEKHTKQFRELNSLKTKNTSLIINQGHPQVHHSWSHLHNH